jgi:uncharacterized protein YjaG (DUF416 family)
MQNGGIVRQRRASVLGRIRKAMGSAANAPVSPEPVFPAVDYAKGLAGQLRGMAVWARTAFAAACAERLQPAYVAFRETSGTADGGIVRRALDLAWEGAMRDALPQPGLEELIERCIELIPGQDDDFTIPTYADDAIAATVYALKAVATLDADAPGWAAERGTEAIDVFLTSSGGVADWSGAGREGAETSSQQVFRHPLFRAELARRESDLARLAQGDREDAVRDVRARAMGTSLLPLDRLDHGLDDEADL